MGFNPCLLAIDAATFKRLGILGGRPRGFEANHTSIDLAGYSLDLLAEQIGANA